MPELTGVAASIVGVLVLLGVLGFAILRPHGLPEATAAVPAAGLILLLGMATPAQALNSVAEIGPTLAFLSATLVIAYLADADGVFYWLGKSLGRGSRGSAQRLLLLVFIAASLTTALLSLDATVVLLTPAILTTVKRLKLPAAPHLYASAHLSNSASLLMPVSNLTNLLAFQAAGISFLGFTGLMVLPWLVAVGVEYGVFRWFFHRDLAAIAPAIETALDKTNPPRVSLGILGLVLAGFAISPVFDVAAVWVAVAGALVMTGRALTRGQVGLLRILREVNLPFLLFVAGLSVVVVGATSHGIETAVADLLPTGVDLLSLLAVAAFGAVLANLVNNLPATLLMLAAMGPHPAAGIVLAMLIGVNVGPNLTYTGSLATLLWRRVLIREGKMPSLGRFTRLGLITTPLALVGSVAALGIGLAIFG